MSQNSAFKGYPAWLRDFLSREKRVCELYEKSNKIFSMQNMSNNHSENFSTMFVSQLRSAFWRQNIILALQQLFIKVWLLVAAHFRQVSVRSTGRAFSNTNLHSHRILMFLSPFHIGPIWIMPLFGPYWWNWNGIAFNTDQFWKYKKSVSFQKPI